MVASSKQGCDKKWAILINEISKTLKVRFSSTAKTVGITRTDQVLRTNLCHEFQATEHNPVTMNSKELTEGKKPSLKQRARQE